MKQLISPTKKHHLVKKNIEQENGRGLAIKTKNWEEYRGDISNNITSKVPFGTNEKLDRKSKRIQCRYPANIVEQHKRI